MKLTADGGYILAGGGDSILTSRGNFQLVKTNALGYEEWKKIYTFIRREIAISVQQTADNGYILGGDYQDVDGIFRTWIVRTDSSGDSLWSVAFGGPEQYGLRAIMQTEDGGYLLSGYKRQDEYTYDVAWLVKLAPEMSTDEISIPRSACLLTAYPNPFNSTTQIEFTLPVTQRVSLRLYDVLGREVAMLLNEMKTAGEHRVRFDGGGLSSGVYFCRMEAGKETRTQKIVLMK